MTGDNEILDQNDTKQHKNSYCRKLYIKNFRNIGITKPVEITLNRSLDKEHLGGLVILIGQSGTGKSNILDATETLGTNQSHDNFPEFIEDSENQVPMVFLTHYDDEIIPINFDGSKPLSVNCDWSKAVDIEAMSNLFRDLINLMARNYRSEAGKFVGLFNSEVGINELSEVGDFLLTQSWDNLSRYVEQSGHDVDELCSLLSETIVDCDGEIPFEITYGFSSKPRVIRYHQKNISSRDLLCPCDQLNPFMTQMLSRLLDGNGLNLVKAAYEKYRRDGNISKLDKTENMLNKDIQRFADSFNKLYMNNGIGYSFKIRLLDARIGFSMMLGEEPKVIDKESTGFRWFFDFFFNLLCSNNLKRGDIIIMDEPGTNLHVSAQTELHEFIREFAIREGITFFMSTHSPFLISCDHLDEIRIVSRVSDRESKVFDKYTVVNPENPDQMDSILDSLTVGRHVLFDPNDKVYYVEGITDYNYLTAFKHLFGIEGITFLPVNGLGDETDGARRKRIIEVLMKIDRSPTLIVDGDGAGNAMVESANGTGLEVLPLSEIDKRFTSIEKLFSQEDRKRFIPTKEWHSSSIFKQYIFDNKAELSETTLKNFRKLFDRLED